jgi:hypothetical protein
MQFNQPINKSAKNFDDTSSVSQSTQPHNLVVFVLNERGGKRQYYYTILLLFLKKLYMHYTTYDYLYFPIKF